MLQRVLITRPEPGASQTAGRLKALGLVPVVSPILSTTSHKVTISGRVAATLLTSGNAVGGCPSSLHDRPVFTVGTATATKAFEAGFTSVFNANGDAATLESLVVDQLSPALGSLFLPVGQGQGMDLASSLRQRGFQVIRRVAYRTMYASLLPHLAAVNLRDGLLDTALFFSSEASRRFVYLLRAAGLANSVRAVQAVSISERAAVPLRSLPWRRVSIAAKPDQDSMLVLLND